MKVIYCGTPDFAVPPLKNIIKSTKHEVVAVITQPDRPVGRKAIITPSPVKIAALESNIPVLQFENIRREGVEAIKEVNADIMVTCAYGQILSQEIIDICKHGIVNIHASLLPKYRGAAPIQYAVINGDRETGITFMKTEAGLDTGDIIEQYSTPVHSGETTGELTERLSVLAAEKVCGILDEIECGTAVFTKQDDSISSYVKTIKKEQSIIDFSKNCNVVANFINGMNPWPVAHSSVNGKNYKFYRASAIDGNGNFGEIIRADKKLVVACGKGAIEVFEIQEEGGKKLPAASFLLGRKLKVGDVFGR